MFTTAQLICHLVGDYVLQTDHMALIKRKSWAVAMAHGLAYSLPFLLLRPSLVAWAAIAVSHAVIDRLGLARYVSWAKNWLSPIWIKRCADTSCAAAPLVRGRCAQCGAPGARNYPWAECEATGYHSSRPAWLAVWLTIITDNLMHLLCNGAALRWL